MVTKIVDNRCIELSRDKNTYIDITSANILGVLVVLNGSKILDKFEEHGITGKEIKYLYIACGSNLDKLSSVMINESPLELLAKIKESRYYLNVEQKNPKGISKLMRHE